MVLTYIQVDVPEETWNNYKALVTKNITLEGSIIILIEKAIKEQKVINNVEHQISVEEREPLEKIGSKD
jgi:hypothetical protein